MADTQDYEKQVAVIIPKWCLDVLLDHLDTQYDALRQEVQFYNRIGDASSYKSTKEELELHGSAIMQIDNQLKS